MICVNSGNSQETLGHGGEFEILAVGDRLQGSKLLGMKSSVMAGMAAEEVPS